MKRRFLNKKLVLTNMTGAIGYSLTLVSGTLLLSALFIVVLGNIDADSSATSVAYSTPPTGSAEPSVTTTILGYVVAAVALGFALYLLVTLPYYIGKRGSQLMRWLLVRLHIDRTRRQLFLLKCVVAVLPTLGFMLLFFVYRFESLTFSALHTATILLTALALASFTLQLFLAKRFKLSFKQMW